jgi:hypothetical protein
MRRLIATVTETITTVFGTRPNGNDVIDLATPRLRALTVARTLLVRLTGRVPAGWQVADMRHMQPAVAVGGAARLLKHYCLSTLRSRPSRRRVEPGAGASLRRF